jgi:transcriptional regulator with XRE-family HTH domain
MESRPLQDLLRELRQSRGATLREAAKALEVNPGYLSRVERGEKPASAEVLARASVYYDAPQELLALSRGQLPSDIIELFRSHPELLDELRSRYGSG